MAIRWLDDAPATPSTSRKVKWLDDERLDFSNTAGGYEAGRFGEVGGPSEVPTLGFIPEGEDTQTAPRRQGLLERAGESALRMAAPVATGVRSAGESVVGGVRTIPSQAASIAGGVRQAYGELTPRAMFPFSSAEEVEQIRASVGEGGAQQYAEAQDRMARIRQEALDRGADPFLLDVATTAPQTAAMAAGSLINPALGVGLLGGMVGPQSYAGFRQEGLTPGQAAQAATAETAFEMVPSIVPALAVARAGRMGRGPGAVAVGAAEAGQEVTTDLLSQGQRVALGLQESIDPTQALYAGTLGAAIGGPIGAAVPRSPSQTRRERIQRAVELPTPEANVAADITAQIQQEAGVKPPKPRGRLNLETGKVEPVTSTPTSEVTPVTSEPLSDVVEDEGPSAEAFNAGLEALRARVQSSNTSANADPLSEPLGSPTARAEGTPTLTPPSTLNLATEPYRASQGVSTGVPGVLRGRDEEFSSDVEMVDGGKGAKVITSTNPDLSNEVTVAGGAGGIYRTSKMKMEGSEDRTNHTVLNEEGDFVPATTINQASHEKDPSKRPFKPKTAEARQALVDLVAEREFAQSTGDKARAKELDGQIADIVFGKVAPTTEAAPVAAAEGPIPQTNPESVKRGQRQVDQGRAEDEVIQTMLPADAKYLSAVARMAREEGVALEPAEIYSRMQALKAADTSRPAADSLGTVDWNSLTPQEQKAFEGMFERRETEDAERQLGIEAASMGRQAAAQTAREMGINNEVEVYSNATGVGTVYASTIDDLEGLVKPEFLKGAKQGDTKRAAAGANLVRKGTYYEGNMTVSGKPLMVIYPEGHVDAKEAAFTAAHELAGHHGLRTLVDQGKRGTYTQVMNQARLNPIVAQIADKIGSTRKSTDKVLMTEEALSDLNASLRTSDGRARIKEKYGVELPRSSMPRLRALLDQIINALKGLVGRGGFSNAQVEQLLNNAWKAAQSTAPKTRAERRAAADSLDSAEPSTPAAVETDPTLQPTRRYSPTRESIRQWMRVAEELFVPGRVSSFRGLRGEKGATIKKGMRSIRDLMETMKGTKTESNQKGYAVKRSLERAMAADGVSDADLSRALETGDYTGIPEKSAQKIQTFRIESNKLRLRIVEDMLAITPYDRMTPKEKNILNEVVTNENYFHRSYAMDVDPEYANRIMNRVTNDKGTEEEIDLVNRVTQDIKSLILIPPNLRELVASGRIDKNRLNELYEVRIGPDADKKGKETLVRELEELRNMYEGADYNNTVNELRAELAAPTESKIGAYFRGARADMGIVEARADVPQSFREFWGEIDPNKELPLAAAITTQKMNALADNLKLLRYGKSIGRREGWLSDSPKEGYKQLKGKTFGMLQNKYVPVNVAEMLEQQIIAGAALVKNLNALLTDNPEQYTNAFVRTGVGAVTGLAGRVKYNQVILKGISWLTNGISNMSVMLANGNLPALNGTIGIQGFNRGIQGVVNTVGASFRSEVNPFTSEITRNGLVQSPSVGDLNSALRKDITATILGKDNTWMNIVKRAVNAIDTGALTIGEAYAVLDLWATGANYFKNKDDIQKHWDKIGKDYSDLDLEFAAASMTRSTNFNWSMVPKILQIAERVGRTQFGPYFFETFRVPISNMIVGLQQIEEGRKTKDGNYIRVGFARLAGAMAATKLNPVIAMVASAFGAAFLGDDEDEKGQIEAVVANNDFVSQPYLMKVGEKPDGTGQYFPTGRLTALEPSEDTLYRVANGESPLGAIKELLFANTLWTRLGSIYEQSGPGGDANKIRSKIRSRSPELFAEETNREWSKAAFVSLSEILMPSVVSDVVTAMDKYSRKSQDANAVEVAATALGLTLTEYHPLKSLGTDTGYGNRFDRTTGEAWRALSGKIGAPASVTKGDVMEWYAEYRSVEEEAKLDLALAINAAKDAGHEPSEIAAQLRQGGVSRKAARKLSLDPSTYTYTPERMSDFLDQREESRLESSPESVHQAIKDEFKEKRRLLREVMAEFNQRGTDDGSQ